MTTPIVCRVDHRELLHFRAECRFISALLALSMVFNMLEPAILIFSAPETVLSQVASSTRRPEWLALFFIQAAIALIPYVWVQAFHPRASARRWATKLACFSLCCASALWALLAFTSRGFDFAVITGLFLRNSAGAVTFALALAISLNNELLRNTAKNEA